MSDFGKAPPATPLFSNRLYDRLKYVALVLLPAFSALYFGLGEIWGLPKVTEVIGTVAVLDTVLGMLLRKSNETYKNSDARFDGHINVIEDEGAKVAALSVTGNAEEVLTTKDELTLKVHQDEPVAELPVEEIVEASKPRKRAPRKRL